MPAEDRPYGMAVSALPGVGAVRARRLRAFFGSYRQAWEARTDRLRAAAILPGALIPPLLAAKQRICPDELPGVLARHKVTAVFDGDASYPRLLASLHDAPPVVYIRGGLAPGGWHGVALVGTRRMSAYGRFMAARFAREIAASGYVIVSGLARGIDAAAHQAVLDCGGVTIAVLAGGLDVIYPPEHQDLAASVAARGALITEYLPGTPTVAGNFPARNRLIAGMTLATVVVEAGAKSGALLTANMALEQGREVFAVPGRVGDPGSAGVHALLRDGAGLAESAADILAGLPRWARPSVPSGDGGGVKTGVALETPPREADDGTPASTGEAERRIMAMVASGPRREQELIDASAAAPGLARAALVRLEIQGRIERLPGAIFISGTHGRKAQPPEVAEWKGP
ncbi:MAG: DNA-processing protein DprA [Bacillota bacterium]|nr:DNA-processing protein DprA [Bacillota bacterium]